MPDRSYHLESYKRPGPSCSNIVSLTCSLMIKKLTVLVSNISNSQVFFAEKKMRVAFAKLVIFFQQKF